MLQPYGADKCGFASSASSYIVVARAAVDSIFSDFHLPFNHPYKLRVCRQRTKRLIDRLKRIVKHRITRNCEHETWSLLIKSRSTRSYLQWDSSDLRPRDFTKLRSVWSGSEPFFRTKLGWKTIHGDSDDDNNETMHAKWNDSTGAFRPWAGYTGQDQWIGMKRGYLHTRIHRRCGIAVSGICVTQGSVLESDSIGQHDRTQLWLCRRGLYSSIQNHTWYDSVQGRVDQSLCGSCSQSSQPCHGPVL